MTVRPADLIEDQLPEIREEIKEYAKSDEDVLMYALFPQQAKDFLGRREDPFYDVPLQTVDVTLELTIICLRKLKARLRAPAFQLFVML